MVSALPAHWAAALHASHVMPGNQSLEAPAAPGPQPAPVAAAATAAVAAPVAAAEMIAAPAEALSLKYDYQLDPSFLWAPHAAQAAVFAWGARSADRSLSSCHPTLRRVTRRLCWRRFGVFRHAPCADGAAGRCHALRIVRSTSLGVGSGLRGKCGAYMCSDACYW